MDITFIPKQPNYEHILRMHPPVLANRYLPDWYKNMERTIIRDDGLTGKTAKKCPAIQDTLTEGFIIPMWSKFEFASVKDENGYIVNQNWNFFMVNAVTEDIEKHLSSHTQYQVEGMDINLTIDNRLLKMTLPYKIIVPEGYNIKYSDPFYHFRKDIRCLTGIVEADKWGHVTLPFELLQDNFTIEAGQPLVHGLIYKREEEPLNIITRNGTDEEYKRIYDEHFELFTNDKNYRTRKNK